MIRLPIRAIPGTAASLLLLSFLLLFLPGTALPAGAAGPEQAGDIPSASAGVLSTGFYQALAGPGKEGTAPTCRLAFQPDGSLHMLLTGGGPGAGFAFAGRLLPSGPGRYSGTFLSLPGSCCPARGRQEIEATGPDSFRFTLWTPSLDGQDWRVVEGMEYRRRQDAPAEDGLARWAGSWNIGYHYTGLLPGGARADPGVGVLEVAARDGGLAGAWSEPGLDASPSAQVTLTPGPQGLKLTLSDAPADFRLEADLKPSLGGLVLAGPFTSSLGAGRITLARAGLPAGPAVMEKDPEGGPSGLWVDPRTGSDFWDIKGSPEGFSFTIYGGSLSAPRFLTKGHARPLGGGVWAGQARDQEGYCCGNQGRVEIRSLDGGRLEVRTVWWPLGSPDPGSPPGPPFILERKKGAAKAEAPGVAGARDSSQVVAPRPGLPAPAEGSIQAFFDWKGQNGLPQTLFSQGGYRHELWLGLDNQGRPQAVMAGPAGPLTLTAPSPLSGAGKHRLWLSYRAGGQAVLLADGSEAARMDLPGPWTGSEGPYLLGRDRRPGRELSGGLEKVELWERAQDPASPEPPALVLAGPGSAPEPAPAPDQAAQARPLMRLWHPGLLRHAYAVEQAGLDALKEEGYSLEGPVGLLPDGGEGQGRRLWSCTGSDGAPLLQTADSAPLPGCKALGPAMGPGDPRAVPLWELSAVLPGPGGAVADKLYTSRQDTREKARAAGYSRDREAALVLQASEPEMKPLLLPDWTGSWRGEGWGRFFIEKRGDEVFMFWYYGRDDSPHYLGRYTLGPGGRTAEGMAVGNPGPQASYYRQTLELREGPQGPRLLVTAWRVAAPMDDGRMVKFSDPESQITRLHKVSETIPGPEAGLLQRYWREDSPSRRLTQAAETARAQGRLLVR